MVWGRTRYLSVMEAPHNIKSSQVSGEETFRFFETWRPDRSSNPRSPTFQAGIFNHCTRAPAPDQWQTWQSQDYYFVHCCMWDNGLFLNKCSIFLGYFIFTLQIFALYPYDRINHHKFPWKIQNGRLEAVCSVSLIILNWMASCTSGLTHILTLLRKNRAATWSTV